MSNQLSDVMWLGAPNALRSIQDSYAMAMNLQMNAPARAQELISKFEQDKSVQASDFGDGPSHYLTTQYGKTAIITVSGGMVHQSEWWHSYTNTASYEAINHALISAENDPEIATVVMMMRTTGGMVSGVGTVTDTMKLMSKPVIAYSDSLTASAGYWIASGAKMIGGQALAQFGSVGVIYVHTNITEMMKGMGVKQEIFRVGDNKALVNPYEELTDKAREDKTSELERYYDAFVTQISEGRKNLNKSAIPTVTEGGKMFSAKTAMEKGLIDFVAPFSELLAYIEQNFNNNGNTTLG